MTLVGGEWIADEKGFQATAKDGFLVGHAGGLGRIGAGAKRAPREVHVDLSQELISDWTYEQIPIRGGMGVRERRAFRSD